MHNCVDHPDCGLFQKCNPITSFNSLTIRPSVQFSHGWLTENKIYETFELWSKRQPGQQLFWFPSVLTLIYMKLLNVCANYSNSTSSFMFTNPDTRIQKLIPDDVVLQLIFNASSLHSRYYSTTVVLPITNTIKTIKYYLNKDWGCVILREIDFLLKICW